MLLIIATLVNQNYKVVNAHKKTIHKRGTRHRKKRECHEGTLQNID